VEVAVRGIGGSGFVTELEPGDWVSLHWEWVCDRLTERQLRALQHYTTRHLDIVNDGAVTRSPAGLLG
jgi:hypothetical protein